jgi:hypothetical protein
MLAADLPRPFLVVVIVATSYAMACAVIHARTMPTFQAVTRSDNLIGLGNVPAATLRQSVGALNGKGAGLSGRFGLRTSCDSRTNALSGSASNIDAWMVCFCAGVPGAIGTGSFTISLQRLDRVLIQFSGQAFQLQRSAPLLRFADDPGL